MKKIFRISLGAIAFLISAAALGAKTVEAPESPFNFKPLEMYDFPDKDFVITKYGARPDTLVRGISARNQKAIDKALLACSKAGGGRVVVPAGLWFTGPITLQSGCNLYLSEGAKLLFDDDISLYSEKMGAASAIETYTISPLIYAYECQNIAVTGPGTIEAKMDLWRTRFKRVKVTGISKLRMQAINGDPVEERHTGLGGRPYFVYTHRCQNVQLADFHLIQSPSWCIHLYQTKDCWVHGLDVCADGHNSDGLDLQMTQHVIVEDCSFEQSDDAIVLKSGRDHDGWRVGMPTCDVVIRRCLIKRGGAIIACGSELSGGIERVYAHDCEGRHLWRFFNVKTTKTRGGYVKDIMLENCYSERVQCVMRVVTNYDMTTDYPEYGIRKTPISNLTLRNVKTDWAEGAIFLDGDDEKPVENVIIENVTVQEASKYITKFNNVVNLQMNNVNVVNFSRTGKNMEGIWASFKKYM